MAENKKFGTFAGVFTPSILTILGVILYMRMGWVVGNAGLVGALIIVVIAHIISVSTGLSVSSVATDKKVGAGGIYYILSRSMGIPIGGAIGLALYVGTAFSIALYLIGFAESLNGYFGFRTDINGLRLSGSIALIGLTVIALISTSVALKTQFFILAAIVISLVSIFFGTRDYAPQTVEMFSGLESAPLEMVFAIFFPAVTGFTAGIAMSGNLEDPKKSIPVGTIAAIACGFLVYIGIVFFLSYAVNSELLRNDYNVLMKIAWFAPAVVAGIWGATLSSALGGILGGPRILQAMSVDKVTPGVFGRGRGKENEPVNALILVFVIAQAGILIGELDVIARVVSMFYLAAYGFINLSFFLESWANPDFQPSFKVSRWIGLLGFLACFGVMFKLDMIAMFGSIILIVGIHFWLQRKQIELETGNVWQSVWEKIVTKGLNKLETNEVKDGKWNPNIILFSGESAHRPYLLEFSKSIAGRTGIVTNFNLIKRGTSDTPITKTDQTIKDQTFEELGIFGRKIEVDNIYKGIENVATTFGFSGLDPNTVMMGWKKTTENLSEFSQMTQNLIQLDYNILFLDFDKENKFGEMKTVDLWWRQTDSNNAEMMLNIARFIIQSRKWKKAKIRVLFVNNSDTDNALIRAEISKQTDKLRIKAEIKVISNSDGKSSFYEIIELQSSTSDLVVLGIPDEAIESNVDFVRQTDKFSESVGTLLLVKASNKFNRLDFNFAYDKIPKTREKLELQPLSVSEVEVLNDFVLDWDKHLEETANSFSQRTLSPISSLYHQFIDDAEKTIETIFSKSYSEHSVPGIVSTIKTKLGEIIHSSENFRTNKLSSMEQVLERGITEFVSARTAYVEGAPRSIKFDLTASYPKPKFSNQAKVNWKAAINYHFRNKILPNTRNTFYYLGVQNFSLVKKLAEHIVRETHVLIENLSTENTNSMSTYRTNLAKLFELLREECVRLDEETLNSLRAFDREVCNELMEAIDDPAFNKRIKDLRKNHKHKDALRYERNVAEHSSNWFRNQEAAHAQAEAGLNLLIASLSLYRINERIKNRITNTVIELQQYKIGLLSKAVEYSNSELPVKKPEEISKRKLDRLAENIDYINLDNILDNDEASILAVSGSTPETVELVSAESFKMLLKNQGESVERISLNLGDIGAHIIQSSYLSPLQTIKENLAKASNEIAEEIYYSANLINHSIENSDGEEINAAPGNIAADEKNKIDSYRLKLAGLADSFAHELKTTLQSTLAELNIKTILESADSYAKIARAPLFKPTLKNWYGEQKSGVATIYDKVIGFVIQRKQEIDTRRFEVRDDQFLNSIEQSNGFMSLLILNPELQKELPFYQKKLSVVGSLKKANFSEKDENLLSARNAISKINSGVSGGIIVLGESLSGKTFFTETVAKTFLNGDIIQIKPPQKQSFHENDLHFAFQKSFSRSGTAQTILEQINPGTVLVFDDIERWWMRTPDGNRVINYLAKIIEDYGNKHYFLINSNVHSFQIIKQTSNLERQLLSTIILAPSTKSELKKVVMDRYHIAGTKLWYNGKPLDEARKLDTLFSEIYTKSGGKIGLALNFLGSNIEKDGDGNFSVRMPKAIKFPNIKNPYWKIILYHLLIQNRLTEVQIREIFKPNENNWVLSTLKQMEKTQLIYKQFNNSYGLNNAARHYVENWLKELKILKQVNQ